MLDRIIRKTIQAILCWFGTIIGPILHHIPVIEFNGLQSCLIAYIINVLRGKNKRSVVLVFLITRIKIKTLAIDTIKTRLQACNFLNQIIALITRTAAFRAYPSRHIRQFFHILLPIWEKIGIIVSVVTELPNIVL